MTIHHSQMRDPHDKDSSGTLKGSNETASKHQYTAEEIQSNKFVQHARNLGYSSQQDVVAGKANTSLPPVKENTKYGKNTLAPERITSHRMPHLSPVGSLTNLLTDLSSTGFRKNNNGSLATSQRDSSLARASKIKKNPAKDIHNSLA